MNAEIVDYAQAKKMVEAGAQLLDVRTPKEYAESYVGGDNLPLDEVLDRFAEVLSVDKERPIVMFCQSGNRTQKAAALLRGLGYHQLFDLQSYKHWQG